MRKFWVGLWLFGVAVPSVAQPNCSDIAEATTAEMQAGVEGQWTPEMASLVRRAAASACVKSQSGRYLDAGERPDNDALTVQSTAIDVGEDAEPAPEVGVSAGASTEAEEAASTGITFKPMSGSPSSKPYMRKRRNKDS